MAAEIYIISGEMTNEGMANVSMKVVPDLDTVYV